ncbi:MAG: DUF3619 family protein [Oxalicibacterium faecigallinarum]|uniref:DUF3619 family protein n=1 Tax=Oxalicibacterium faecigallinarum TaxID=573741 RepID=UPI00280A3F80|nr:DUF3619 family protein [Oxalicibacterium faecigallinarum]MDQ7968486.1 DUF3619 family protein [Oxalicibacterium faecigallinarum]
MNTTKELNTAYRLRHALDERTHELPENVRERLSSARKIALSHKKSSVEAPVAVLQPAMVGRTSAFRQQGEEHGFAWLGRMSVLVPLAALVFGIVGIYQYEQHQQMLELAAIDAEVLTDDLPLSAYLDHGFDAFVTKGQD